MRQSQLFSRTTKEAPHGEESVNAQLLERGGFVTKHMAGVYSYLPLGVRVLRRIERIIREEMNAVGGQEVYFPALQPKDIWEKTGRWAGLGAIMYQFTDQSDKPVGLAATHEEVAATVVKDHILTYKDLPKAIYQLQSKFRHEPRAKSGLLRGREFSMKDLYSFHADTDDLNRFYELMKIAYKKIFDRVTLPTRIVDASGGDFSQEYSHEFQVVHKTGEDHVYVCPNCDFGQNMEIGTVHDGDTCPKCGQAIVESNRSIEVGNIFRLGTRYSSPLGANFIDKSDKAIPLVMGSYGIGISRLLGTIVEVHHDQDGIIWPESVSPFKLHLLLLGKSEAAQAKAETIEQACLKRGIEILYDDRSISPGAKLKDADLLGIPHQVIVSDRTKSQVEYRTRHDKQPHLQAWSTIERLLID